MIAVNASWHDGKLSNEQALSATDDLDANLDAIWASVQHDPDADIPEDIVSSIRAKDFILGVLRQKILDAQKDEKNQ